MDPTDLNKAVKTTRTEEIEAFSSKIIHGHTKTRLLGNNMHVMMQTLKGSKDPTCLMAWVSRIPTLKWHSKQVSCSHSQKSDGHSNHYHQGIKVTQVVAVKYSAPSESGTQNFGELGEMQGI